MNKQAEFATWFYRGLVALGLWYIGTTVNQNLSEFHQMKADVVEDQRKHIKIDLVEDDHEKRITKLERK